MGSTHRTVVLIAVVLTVFSWAPEPADAVLWPMHSKWNGGFGHTFQPLFEQLNKGVDVFGEVQAFTTGGAKSGSAGDGANGEAPAAVQAVEQWFQQKLDHFDSGEKRMWQQRYYVNATAWKPGGPVFLIIGGEGAIGPYMVTYTVVNEYADRFNGLIIALEHRFYGKSRPTADLSVDNLKYLSLYQALADLARFRREMGEQLKTGDAPWITVGGSYPGSLSAWARQEYPELFAMALASSAPVRSKVNFHEYDEVVARALGPSCSALIRQADEIVDKLVETPAGRDLLEKKFGVCPNTLTKPLDWANFDSMLAINIMVTVQYNNAGGARTIEEVCTVMEAARAANSDEVDKGKLLDQYAALFKMFQDPTAGCVDGSFEGMLKELSNVEHVEESMDRQWYWQMCTELGFFQTAIGGQEPFSHRLDLRYFTIPCTVLFKRPGPPDTETAVNNILLGADHPHFASRILFTNGRVDPWHVLSVLKDLSPTIRAELMQTTAHCADLLPSWYLPNPELVKTRALAVELFTKWIDEYRQELSPVVPIDISL